MGIAIEALIARYGVLAIFVGAGIEGEAVVATGGILARKGLLPFWGVAIAASAGSFLVDQLWFLAGRHLRDRAWVRRFTALPRFHQALTLLERHSTAFILAFRFVYGMRTVSPIAIGASKVPTTRFLLLNAVAAAVWGPLIAWVGYGLGDVITRLVQRVGPWPLPAGIALIAAIVAVVVWLRRRRA